MTTEPINRMAQPVKRGRPTLVEQAKRTEMPPPLPIAGDVPRFKCTQCGRAFLPKVYRTLPGNVRIMRCDGCGYQHKIPQTLLSQLS